ncbi:DUF2000 domain-containing protein [Fusibacter ferrireducens]|uniref:DUF2000 domain-containing protein n=1 Tax=Fusibacter ferrireducens TaxID=2785058 RepID=A0ABR9ZXH6_9FIRM|nr:DUF2000 domain-containing protein [Fusibacter ferrireducens]MBF4694651.1 DUF2000 domain-containing protein [Fusibacter ferrireducens]
MNLEKKIAIIVKEDLMSWQKLNVTAFLAGGIGGSQEVIGEPYWDASDVQYLPMIDQPIIIYAATQAVLKEILKKGLSKEVEFAVYTEELFNTGNDIANREQVRAYKTEALNIVGLGIYGKKNHVNKLVKGLKLHD